jgi:hypothetical protein
MAVVVILQQLALHQHYGAEKKDCGAEMRVLRHYNTCALPHTPLHSNHELVIHISNPSSGAHLLSKKYFNEKILF